MNFMAWLAQRWANIVHPTDNHTPTVRLNANVAPTFSIGVLNGVPLKSDMNKILANIVK